MTTDHEHFDPHDDVSPDIPRDDAQLARLLRSGYAQPEPSPEFSKNLLQQLDQEFRNTYPTSQPETTKAVSPRPQHRVSLRLAMTLATAASLLFAFSLWNSQSAYGWAAMLRALESCDWVQTLSKSTGLNGWVSAPRGVFAIRSDDQIAYHDRQTSSRYLSDRKVISQENRPANASSLSSTAWLDLLLPEKVGHFELLSESWRQAPRIDDSNPAIELQATLKIFGSQPGNQTSGNQEKRLVQLVFLLDPETHLPKSARLAGNNQTSNRSFEFAYPANGPSSIYALGVPPETPIVAALPTQPTEEVAKASSPIVEKPETQLGPVTKDPVTKDTATEDAATTIATLPPAEKIVEPAPTPITANPVRKPLQPTTQPTAWNLPAQPLAPEALVRQIDNQLAACWQDQGIAPSEPATDSEFLRRVYLDLTGRIPRVSEVYRFLEDPSQNPRQQLVDDLLTSHDHATHLATVWRTLLLPDGIATNAYGGTDKFDRWLADRFEKNLPYDQLVSQLLLAEGRVSDSGPILFYAALKLNPEELAAKTSRAFLGMRMECAQCHDHPFDASVSQQDFWGFAAHFAQISRPQGKMEVTSSVLRVRDNRRGEVRLPDSDEVVPPSLPYTFSEDVDSEDVRQDDTLSRRRQMVDWITTQQNSRFAKATVNRVWQHLFGIGLVDPVDDMRTDNPSICPELLTTLSQDFAASGYDLRRLLRAVVLSEAYQASSRSATDEPSQALAFARMNIKSFTADQLYDCIGVATQHESMNAGNAATLLRFGNSSREAFIAQFRAPQGKRTDYHAGIPQALTLMHGTLVHGATDLASSGLLKSLNAPFFTDAQRVETLFLATLSRYPEPEEQEKMLAYVSEASDDEQRSRALGDILWALLNSAEFTFIH